MFPDGCGTISVSHLPTVRPRATPAAGPVRAAPGTAGRACHRGDRRECRMYEDLRCLCGVLGPHPGVPVPVRGGPETDRCVAGRTECAFGVFELGLWQAG
uniref:(northern house mosquito) hypothetical protein n=1 Tax=Culex pipiens TaxID=7175 RepID=A0A8D8FMH4_CULPI